ncbi:PqqD family peptide modification chaperone [Hymenobacter sp. HMF4947]|uniref:PqqD family peptide modification chaperone n=1 Tax=Hymenobacter ginkgonis TaxID=2682976 RepID=A0A7K1TCW4_9BACT|nr:PqqD family protein [Hymenobacter ginkgonis]MVN76213.1 PqqD family peptide modification chaperone [Hymenobacter ginkgonis]
MKLKKNIATSEAGFVFNPATGDSFAASPLAAEILELLKAGQAPAAIQASLLARYEVSASQLQRDWDDLMAQLHQFQLLES